MNRFVAITTVIAAVGLVGLCGAAYAQNTKPDGAASQSNELRALAVIRPASNSDVHGTVSFVSVKDGVRVKVSLEGLKPGLHGFHIHQYGNCTASDASSAGGHYNPEQQRHGGPHAAHHHAGDFGNIRADKQGRVETQMTFDFISIDGADNPIIGRAVMVHAGKDDLESQPSGAAGARVGCGVIGLTK